MIGRVQKIDRVDPIPRAIKVSRGDEQDEENSEEHLSFSIDVLVTAGQGGT
jgi:hypothetical protein